MWASCFDSNLASLKILEVGTLMMGEVVKLKILNPSTSVAISQQNMMLAQSPSVGPRRSESTGVLLSDNL
jgi:hypothetical protein